MLFLKHNKGNTESKSTANSDIGKLYIKFLREYYSVFLDSTGDDLLMHRQLGQDVHATVDTQGTNYILFGVCDTQRQATENLRSINNCDQGEAKLVKVTPGKIEIIG